MKNIISRVNLQLILGIAFCCSTILASEPIQDEFRKEIPLEPGGSLSLENGIGRIKVTGWDEHKVQIVAVKKVRKYENREEAQELLDRLVIEIKKSDNNVMIKAHFPKEIDLPGNFSDLAKNSKPFEISYQIKLPRHTDLVLEIGVGDLEVSGLEGDIEADLSVGKIDIEKVNGSIEVETEVGKIHLSLVSGPVNATTGVGEIILTLVSGPVNATTGVGEIVLTLPSEAAVDLKASSGMGNIDLDFPLEVVGGFMSKKVQGEINGGGPLISLETGVGEMKLRKASE